MLFTWDFWSDALTRCVRTFCQTLAAVLGGSAMNIWEAGWHSALGVAAGSALLSLLMAADRLTVTPRVDVTVEPLAKGVELPVGCGENLR